MNADPLEHAKLAVILVELFYENLLDLVGGPATVTTRRMRMSRHTFSI